MINLMRSQQGNSRRGISAAVFVAALFALPAVFGQATNTSPGARIPGDSPKAVNTGTVAVPATSGSGTSASGSSTNGAPPDAEMMKQMMELSKLNENHKLIGELAGTWTYTVKFWPAPGAPAQESKGVAVRKPTMEGRFYTLEVNGKMQMPGPDGKMKDVEFKGMSLEGYDNVKKKFVGTWMDNMGTGIMTSEGTYDPATKTFTYTGEYEAIPGMKQKIREVMKVTDKDHHSFDWYETRGDQEVKTMEIAYTRKK
jgi:hypothetical protein